MKHTMKFALLVVGAAGAALLAANMLEAKAGWTKKAQEMGFADVKDCMYCHTAKGKKDLNDVGKWLMEQKEAKKAKDVDLAWLKEYKPAEKK